MGILGPGLLHPLPRIGHEVAKSPIFFVIGIQQKPEVMTAETIESQAVCRQVFLPHGGHQQRSGVAIGAVTMSAMGDGIRDVLQDAGIVRKRLEVIELYLRQFEIRDDGNICIFRC